MKKSLLDVIFMSEKRKGVLLLLQKGAQEMEDLLVSLKTTRQALLPQIRVLEDHYLVAHYKDVYELTTIGKLIVDEMKPLVDTITVLDSDINYWGSHNLDFIPSHLLERIGELGKYEIVNPSLTEINALNQKIIERSLISKAQYSIGIFYHPDFPKLITGMIQNNVHVHFITNSEVLERIKNSNHADFDEFIQSNLFHLYVYPRKINFLALVYNDYNIFMRLLNRNGETDASHIIGSSKKALEWVKELFEYYLKDSIPITEI
jgi:predicted transcriptional regulator